MQTCCANRHNFKSAFLVAAALAALGSALRQTEPRLNLMNPKPNAPLPGLCFHTQGILIMLNKKLSLFLLPAKL